jgi:hypothetical protein
MQVIKCTDSQLKQSDVYYKDTVLNLDNINMTLAASLPFNRTIINLFSNGEAELAAAMVICQADRLNQKLYPPIDFSGIINIAIQSYNEQDIDGQYSTVELYKNNLFNSTSNLPLSNYGIDNIAGFIGSTSSGINRINSAVVDGTLIPFLNTGTVDEVDLADKFYIPTTDQKYSFYSIRGTIQYSSLNVVLDLMNAYNWTICGNIYEDNTFGFAAQDLVQLYTANYTSPIFTCNIIFTAADKITETFISNVCNCMKNINTLRVLNLWTAATVGYEIIYAMKNGTCPIASEFVFIITGQTNQIPLEFNDKPEYFRTTLVIQPFGPWNVTEYFNDCLNIATPQAKSLVSNLINDNLRKSYKCVPESEQNGALLPECSKSNFERKDLCTCTGKEYDPELNPYAVPLYP